MAELGVAKDVIAPAPLNKNQYFMLKKYFMLLWLFERIEIVFGSFAVFPTIVYFT